MRIVFLTFYNQYAFGARCLAASSLEAGHNAWLIKFKRFKSKPVSREDPSERAALEAGGHLPVFEVHPFHDVACPYPEPVTPAEKDLLYARLEALAPDVVGFSLTSSHLPLAREVSVELRRRYPKMLQIWGGIYPTMDPAGSLEYADAACVGEGEGALLDYLADPTRTDIANLHVRGADGVPRANPRRPLIQDLDALPLPLYGEREFLIDAGREWPFAALPHDEVTDQLVISSQRGCPFSCTYCLHGVVRDMYQGQKYLRRKSVERFLFEIEDRVRRFGPRQLNFWDDIFMIHPEWIEEFAAKYPARIGLPFGGYGHPRTTTPAMLRRLREAGCSYVSVGVQSGSQYISHEIYARNATNEQYVQFGRDLMEAGYENVVYDILSRCAFEREEDLRATVHLLAQLPRAVKVTVKHIVFFPFTRISQMERRKDGETPTPEVYHFYEMLYLLVGQPGFEPALVDELVDDPYLRAHPHIVEAWVRQLAAAGARRDELSARVGELERQLPWGVKRAALHLVAQVKKWVRK